MAATLGNDRVRNGGARIKCTYPLYRLCKFLSIPRRGWHRRGDLARAMGAGAAEGAADDQYGWVGKESVVRPVDYGP